MHYILRYYIKDKKLYLRKRRLLLKETKTCIFSV